MISFYFIILCIFKSYILYSLIFVQGLTECFYLMFNCAFVSMWVVHLSWPAVQNWVLDCWSTEHCVTIVPKLWFTFVHWSHKLTVGCPSVNTVPQLCFWFSIFQTLCHCTKLTWPSSSRYVTIVGWVFHLLTEFEKNLSQLCVGLSLSVYHTLCHNSVLCFLSATNCVIIVCFLMSHTLPQFCVWLSSCHILGRIVCWVVHLPHTLPQLDYVTQCTTTTMGLWDAICQTLLRNYV